MNSLDAGISSAEDKDLQQGAGSFPEYRFAAGFDIAIADLKTGVDADDFLDGFSAQNDLMEVLHQHFIELAQGGHPAVVLLHELFYRQTPVAVPVAENLRQFPLMIEQQPVFFPAGDQVQGIAHSPQKITAFQQDAEFIISEKSQPGQPGGISFAELAQGNPANHLDIPQAPRRGFYIGFQLIFGVAVLGVTSFLFPPFGMEKFVAGPQL